MSLGKQIFYAGLAALIITAIAVTLGIIGFRSNPSDTASAIRAAKVGDCLHLVWGSDNPDGSKQVTVTPAQCGSPEATGRVVNVTNTTTDCNGGLWVSDRSLSSPVVLCLVPA